MEDFELSKAVAENLDTCPNCQGKMIQTGTYKVECSKCRMKLEVETEKRRSFNLTIMVGTYSFLGGAILLLVFQLLKL